MSEFCEHGLHRGGLPPCTACVDESILHDLICDARDEFETSTENGDWPEKWDSGKGHEFLARYLMRHVIVTREMGNRSNVTKDCG